MPTLTLNKKVFEELVGKKLPLEQLKDRISMLGTDLEKIEDDQIFVEIFPNRPDLLSEQGFARAFSSFIGVKKGIRKYSVKKCDKNYKVIIDQSVKNIRPYTACAIVKGLNFDSEKIREVIQIQEKLHVTYGRNRKKAAIGIYPLEKISFPITYKADSPEKIKFLPLEAEQEMTGAEILTDHKTGKEYAHLLEGLKKYPYFIDAKKEILSMPPIINSHLTGRISLQTKDVFIECSGFDYGVVSKCLNMLVTALADMNGEIYSLELDYSAYGSGKDAGKKISPDLTPEKMKLDLAYINKLLGFDLTEKQAQNLLEKMGYGYEQKTKEVLVPAYRTDILHQVDLAEDIAIAYGYENVTEEIPSISTIAEENKFEKFARKIREILVGLKLMEVLNYHLLTKEDMELKMNIPESKDKIIRLQNSLGEYNCLRNSLLPNLLKNLKENQHNEYPQNIFEIGKIFLPSTLTETNVQEKNHLSIMLCQEKTDFTEIKQVLNLLINSLGLECSVKESIHPSFISGRIGEIICNHQKIGLIGEISPEVLINWELVMPAVGLELDLEKLFGLIEY